jgi:hypothetical protein
MKIGTCPIKGNENNGWNAINTKVSKVAGVHDLYLVFKGDQTDLFNLDWWMFK